MLSQFLSLFDFELIGKALLVLLVLYVLIILHAKKYLVIVNKGLMLLSLFPLIFYISLIFRSSEYPNDIQWIFAQIFLFLALHFVISLFAAITNMSSFEITSKNSFKLSLLIFFTYYSFNLLYILSGLSSYEFGRARFIIIPIILYLLSALGLFIIAILVTSPKVFLKILILMLGIFTVFMFNAKHTYDEKEKIKYERHIAEREAEKLLDAKNERLNKEAKKVFDKLWNSKMNLSQIEEKLNMIEGETEKIKREKRAFYLMFSLQDEKYNKLLKENIPEYSEEFIHITSMMLEHYKVKNEEEYLKLFSLIQQYSANALDSLFLWEKERFVFKDLVTKNYDEIALIRLQYDRMSSYDIKEYIKYAKYITNEQLREKAISIILNKVNIYLGSSYDNYSISLLDDVILLLSNELKIDNYLIVLRDKLVNLDANVSRWEYKQEEKSSFIGMYHYLGRTHTLIKAIPQPIKDFYLRDINKSEYKVVLDENKSHLIDTHWKGNRCEVETQFNQAGDPLLSYYREGYHFTAENKIYVTQNYYKDKECKKIDKRVNKHEFYVRYKEISVDNNESDLYGIRIEEFHSWRKSFADFKQKDAYFSFKKHRLCFSKSIFSTGIEETSLDNNGNAFTFTYGGFHIQEDESDEVDYENCLRLGI
ncbi:hypothetical protein KKC13_09875 [bacterium]|nr:hypothetical protein [bacterium]